MIKNCVLLQVIIFSLLGGTFANVDQMHDLMYRDFFEKIDDQSKGNWFILFFNPYKQASMMIAAIWEDLAVELDGKVNIGIVDVTMVENRQFIKLFGIIEDTQYFLFSGDQMYEFNGPRTLDDFINFSTEDFTYEQSITIPKKVDLIRYYKILLGKEFRNVQKIFKKSLVSGLIVTGFLCSSIYVSCMIGRRLGKLVLGDDKKKKKLRTSNFKQNKLKNKLKQKLRKKPKKKVDHKKKQKQKKEQ